MKVPSILELVEKNPKEAIKVIDVLISVWSNTPEVMQVELLKNISKLVKVAENK